LWLSLGALVTVALFIAANPHLLATIHNLIEVAVSTLQ
jgi:hypothetical protein